MRWWILRRFEREYLFVQKSHLYGLERVCMSMWLFKFPLVRKSLPQTIQLNGFSSVLVIRIREVVCGRSDCPGAWNVFCRVRMGRCRPKIYYEYMKILPVCGVDQSFYINLCKMHLLYEISVKMEYIMKIVWINMLINYYEGL